MTYASLHSHSHFSLDGVGTVEQWVLAAKRKGLAGLALTDHGDSSSLLELYTLGKKHQFPITMGCEIYLTDQLYDGLKPKKGYYHLTVLVKNFEGYKNLCRLSTLSFKPDHFYYKPRVTIDELFAHKEGLIIGSGCLAGPICDELLKGNEPLAEEYVKEFLKQFKDDYYLELQPSIVIDKDDPTKVNKQQLVNMFLLDYSQRYNIKKIITPDAHIIDESMKVLQDIKLHSRSGKGWDFDQSHHLFTPTQLHDKIEAHHAYLLDDLPDMMANTIEIMQKSQFDMPKFEPLLPAIDLSQHPLYQEGDDDQGLLLKILIDNGRIDFQNHAHVERLKYEMDTLFHNGKVNFISYFLLLEDVIRWCGTNNISVGPGRGSASGSLLSYGLKITHLNPITYSLSFDRFINKARIINGTFPDVDLDFSNSDPVKKYVMEKYGKDKVAILGTFQTLKTKQALKDVLGALRPDMSFPEKNALTSLIPGSPQGSNELEFFSEVLADDKSAVLYDFMVKNRDVYESTILLLGQSRQRGRHPCGVVVSSKPLSDVMPLFSDNDEWATQYSADWVKKVGAIKYDFLGLNTLGDIAKCIQIIKTLHNIEIDPYTIPLDDKKTLDAFSKADTDTIFQYHTTVARKILTDLNNITGLDDLAAITSLGRPGPMNVGMDRHFVKRKNSEELISYPHPSLKDILRDTYGIIVYQEQVMAAVQILGGFSPAEADEVRRSMGDKDKVLLSSFKDRFTAHASSHYDDISIEKANELWSLIESFAGYGFNKSHALAYAMLGYICQYLRQHYTLEWYCAVFSNGSKDDRKELYPLIKDILQLPGINSSKEDFYIQDKKIIMSLSFINGMGERSVSEVASKQPFASFKDFYDRINKRIVRKDVIEALIFADCFKEVELDDPMQLINKLYTLAKAKTLPDKYKNLSLPELIEFRCAALPVQDMNYIDIFQKTIVGSPIKVAELPKYGSGCKLSSVGKLTDFHSVTTKKGDKMAFVNLNNGGQKVRLVVWPEKLQQHQSLISSSSIVQVWGTINIWNNSLSLVVDKIVSL